MAFFGKKKEAEPAPKEAGEKSPPAAEEDPIHIRVRDLKKSYGQVEVLKGVTLDLHRGLINVIIGGSGAGKSVLTRQLLRLEQPDSGQILVDGDDIVPLNDWQLIPVRKKFGMVFQFGALFDSMTVFDNVAFPLREHTKMRPKEIRERVLSRLEDLQVVGAAQKLPGEISGGQNKRAALARALVLEPAILVYDEPTSGLDPVNSRRVDELIKETAEHFGVTSVVITHDMASVFKIGDRVSMIYAGAIEATGTPDEILRTDNEVVVDFLRSSGVTVPRR
jgi:phospholipid/cholesterol/gamma-HCH transport system ATP-binding protein